MTVQPLSDHTIWRYRVLRYGGIVILAIAVIIAILASNRSEHVRWLFKASTPELLAAAKLDPNDEELNLVLARHLNEDGKYEQTYDLMVLLTKRFPTSARCWDRYGTSSAQISHVLEALKAFQREVQIDPNQGNAHATIGSIYIKAGLLSDGIAEIDTARRVQKRVSVNVLLWAQALEAKGRYQEAWDHLVESVNIDPTQDSIWEALGQLAPKVDKVDDAEALMVRRIDFSPMYDLASVRGPLAHLMAATSHDSKTLDQAQLVATLGAHYQTADAQLPLAEILLLKRDLKGARDVLEKGLKMDAALGIKTKNPACMRMLATIADAEGRTADAKRYRSELPPAPQEPGVLAALREAAKRTPTDTAAQISYASALEQFAEYGQAAEICGEILSKDHNNAAATQMIARCRDEALHKLDSTEQAAYIAKLGHESEPGHHEHQ